MRSLPVVLLPLLVVGVLACSKEPPAPTASPSATASTTPPAGQPSSAPASSRATDHFATSKGDLAVTPLEHASVLFELHGEAIYVDPTATAVSGE